MKSKWRPRKIACAAAQAKSVGERSPWERLRPSIYLVTAGFCKALSVLSAAGWAVCRLTPWTRTLGDECLIGRQIFGTAAVHCLAHCIKILLETQPSSHDSWASNARMLSHVPATSAEDKRMVHFLTNRWLAKTTGSYAFLVDWMCPTFGIAAQVHPETTNAYARDPATKSSETYQRRVAEWQAHLPHPEHFPLVLTRPFDIVAYLPCATAAQPAETIRQCIARVGARRKPDSRFAILDLTSLLADGHVMESWQRFEREMGEACTECAVDLEQVICVHRLAQNGIGGLRLLPLFAVATEKRDEQRDYVLEWISRFGLTANAVELDRLMLFHEHRLKLFEHRAARPTEAPLFASQEQWSSCFGGMGSCWTSENPQKRFMYLATLQLLQDLCSSVARDKWEALSKAAPMQSAILELSMTRIKQRLEPLGEEADKMSFHAFFSQLELVHADLTAVLEILRPFDVSDFVRAFQSHQLCIPRDLCKLTRYALHSSAMTSLAGIFKSVERALERPVHILYGDNTYFECVHATERISRASSVRDASDRDWQDVDLLLVQFNPTRPPADAVLRRHRARATADRRRRRGAPQARHVGSSRVDLQACKLEYSIVSPK